MNAIHPPSPAPRVAVLVPYWDFWEASVGPTFRTDREMLLSRVVDQLASATVDVVWGGLVASPGEGAAIGATVAELDPDAILVAQSMAVPPTHITSVLDVIDHPVVVWAVQNSTTIEATFDASDITTLGATVGTPMLTNVLHRRQRPHELYVSALDDEAAPSELASLLQAAGVANRLGSSTMARVGDPVPGYDCVDIDDATLSHATGIRVVRVSAVEIRDRYRRVSEDAVIERTAQVDQRFEVDPAEPHDLARSVQLALALEDFDDDESIRFGAMNCHVPEIRYGDEIAISACYALGAETSRGIPWTCTGDALTAVAMFVGQSLGGAALYHEIEAIDFDTGEVALANSGEHDLGWCPAASRPRLGPNPWFENDAHTGFSAHFELPAGPTSLVGFTAHPDEPSGFRLIVAEGEITGRELPHSPTVGGVFRFASGPVTEAWGRWVNAGVNHHSAACPGHLARQVEAVARFTRIGFVSV